MWQHCIRGFPSDHLPPNHTFSLVLQYFCYYTSSASIRTLLRVVVSTGKVSAVLGALDGLMPMISFPLYTAVYYSTIEAFPGAQFFFGASANLLMALIFM